jgi:lipopolysaccharide O-acetyltransferase
MSGFASIFSRYGVFGLLRLARDIFLSRLFFRNVRVVRYPWYVRGRYGIRFGKGFTSGVGLRIDAFGSVPGQIVIGEHVQFGDYVHVAAVESVIIGDHVLLASRIYISDHDHGNYGDDGVVTLPSEIQDKRPLRSAPVKLGRNVWVGENVCILKGVEIGENSIIGAGAVVTKSMPADCIVVGSPGRVVKRFDHSSGRWIKVEG